MTFCKWYQSIAVERVNRATVRAIQSHAEDVTMSVQRRWNTMRTQEITGVTMVVWPATEEALRAAGPGRAFCRHGSDGRTDIVRRLTSSWSFVQCRQAASLRRWPRITCPPIIFINDRSSIADSAADNATAVT